MMGSLVWVALGGAIGSSLRYGVNLYSGRLFGTDFPWHTLIVNVLGCFAMGVLTGLLSTRLQLSHEARLFLTTGLLGGFTTFSAFALDTAMLVERRTLLIAAAYVAASVVASLVGVFLGLAVTRPAA